MSKQFHAGDKNGQGRPRYKIETKHTERSMSKERSGFSDFMSRMYSKNRKQPKERKVRLSGINKTKLKHKSKRGLQRAETERKLEWKAEAGEEPNPESVKAKNGKGKMRGKSLHHRKLQHHGPKTKTKAKPTGISQSFSKKVIKSHLNMKLRSLSKQNKYRKSYNVNANVAKRLKIFEEKEPSVSDHLSIDGDLSREKVQEQKFEIRDARMKVISPNRIVSGLQIQSLKTRKQKPKRGKKPQKKAKRGEKNYGKSNKHVKEISVELAALSPGNVIRKVKTKRQKTGNKKGNLLRSIELDSLPIKESSGGLKDPFRTLKLISRKTSNPKAFKDDMLRLSSMSEKQKLMKGSHVIDPVRSAGYNTLNFKDIKTTMSWLQNARRPSRKATRESAHKSLSQSKIRLKVQKKLNLRGDKGTSEKPKRVSKFKEGVKKKNVSLISKRYLQEKQGIASRRSTTKERMKKLVSSRKNEKVERKKEEKKGTKKRHAGKKRKARNLEGKDKHKFEEMKKEFQKKMQSKKKGKKTKKKKENKSEIKLKIKNSNFMKEEVEEKLAKLLESPGNSKKESLELTKIIEKSYFTVNSENEEKEQEIEKKVLFDIEKEEKEKKEAKKEEEKGMSKIQRIRKRILEQKKKLKMEKMQSETNLLKPEKQKETEPKPKRKNQPHKQKPKETTQKKKESLSEKVIEKLIKWEKKSQNEDQANLIADSILHNVFKKNVRAKRTNLTNEKQSMQNIPIHQKSLEGSSKRFVQARSVREQPRKMPFSTGESKSTEKQSHFNESDRLPISTKILAGENFLSKTEKSDMNSQPANQESLSSSRKTAEEGTRSEGRNQPMRGETGSNGASQMEVQRRSKGRNRERKMVNRRKRTQSKSKSSAKRRSKAKKGDFMKNGAEKIRENKREGDTSIDKGKVGK